MYLDHTLILQSGPLTDLELNFETDEAGNPKPVILVGKNGSGKSSFLSYVTDALIELAAQHYDNAGPPNDHGTGHQWHRIIGGATMRTGSKFELALMKFSDPKGVYSYVSKGGSLNRRDVQDRVIAYPGVEWPAEGPHKGVYADKSSIANIFGGGCYVSFPANRSEEAHWTGRSKGEDTPTFRAKYQQELKNKISVISTIDEFRSWTAEVILDSLIDAGLVATILDEPEGRVERMRNTLAAALTQATNLHNINTILRIVLKEPSASVIRMNRTFGKRKLQIRNNEGLLMPGFDAFSSGQAMLVSIFGTILRYADTGVGLQKMHDMTGIVLVDEVDAHLHADLQHDVLPRLISLFPKVQFIFTAHSPLFPLGMEKTFGPEGFTLIEFPDGAEINAERFSEFIASFDYLQATKAFDDQVMHRVGAVSRPLVLCEGQTDQKYLETAAELLGFEDLVNDVDFDWIGVFAKGQVKDGGARPLSQAKKTLQNNPKLLRFHTLLLFDCEQKEQEIDEGHLHVRVLKENVHDAKTDRGIENLLPSSVFQSRFFTSEIVLKGLDSHTLKTFQKVKLCDYLCNEKRDAADFELFRPELERIRACLFPDRQS
ncbi:AAA family ATPase [Sulfitobacter sp. G21635-S1]|uniref:AAA family ATPase n=1 Tax=Sulfitobacter sp. G21635-S1 TaxID=3014043 RepID=UPI0022AEDBCF|nr:AAA family ATPase [Sulfitobacter sp. G21635-S1]MCZ4258261.1 AAA family ATPase [Sulfitobacter sp. G21635-S1]